jgi:hypothetical protein
MKAVDEAGGLIKNGEVETTNNAKLKNLTIFDTSIGIDITPKEGTFIAKGHISKTTLLGDIKMQTFNGEILLRNNNISPSNINWSLVEAMDNSNLLKLSNNDIELIAGGGADGSQLRFCNSVTGGSIKFRMGSGKLRSNLHDALNIYNTQATSQIQIGNNDTLANRYDTTSKVIIDHTQLNDGLKVCKALGSTTRVNHDSVNTGAIILQDGYSGTTTKALYTIENGAKIMYYGDQIYPPVTQLQAGVGGITYLIDNPTNVTNGSIPTITMSGTYTSAVGTSITRSGYTVGLSYQLATIKSDYIPSGSNPILDGVYEANLWANYQGNNPAKLYSKLYLTAETPSFTGSALITKGYSGSGSGTVQAIKTLQIPVSQVSTGFFIPVVGYVDLSIGIIVFPAIQVVSSGTLTLTCTLIDNNGNILYTFPTISATASTSDRVFSGMNGANPSPVTATNLQFFQFQVAITNGTGTISQASARGIGDANYQITLKVKMMIYDGINNQTTLNYNTTNLYALTIPLNSVDITQYTIFSKLEYEPYFIQNSGSASNHSISLLFRDGNLSHIHTTINPTSSAVSTPTLASVLTTSNSAGANTINMNNNQITGISGLIDNNGFTYLVKNLVQGNNITITNSAGVYTINASPFTEQAPFYSTTVTLNNNGLTTVTLPGSGVNLQNYDIELRISMTFENSGAGYTFFAIQYNGYYNGKTTWTNHRNQDVNFSNTNVNNGFPDIPGGTPGGFYIQSYLNPYFGFMLPYDSTSSIQFLSSNLVISKTNYASDYAPVLTKFSTTVGASNRTPVTSNDRMWSQDGMIHSGQNYQTTFPNILTVSISMANQARTQYSGVPCQFTFWIKKK